MVPDHPLAGSLKTTGSTGGENSGPLPPATTLDPKTATDSTPMSDVAISVALSWIVPDQPAAGSVNTNAQLVSGPSATAPTVGPSIATAPSPWLQELDASEALSVALSWIVPTNPPQAR